MCILNVITINYKQVQLNTEFQNNKSINQEKYFIFVRKIQSVKIHVLVNVLEAESHTNKKN